MSSHHKNVGSYDIKLYKLKSLVSNTLVLFEIHNTKLVEICLTLPTVTNEQE
jgi:hypothetical protein